MAFLFWRPQAERESHPVDEDYPLPVQVLGGPPPGVVNDQVWVGGALQTPVKAFTNVAAAQTDSVLVTAVSGRKIRMLYYFMIDAGTATNVTFNSKGSGAGTAISSLKALAINGGAVVPLIAAGWFETNPGEALTMTTGAGSTVGIDYATVLV